MTTGPVPVDGTDEPHDEARAFLERLRSGATDESATLQERRASQRQRSLGGADPEPVGDVVDHVVRGPGHGLPVREYVPGSAEPAGTLVWAHGGRFVLGDVETEDATARALTNATGWRVVSVDYRLAPEHEFPAALEDFYAALEWVADGSSGPAAGDAPLAAGGQSAGANLAAAASMLARDRGDELVDYQVLVVPVVGFSGRHGGNDRRDDGTPEYLPHRLHAHNPYVYPLEAAEHGDLPPATVVTAGHDPNRLDGRGYAERLDDAEVDVRHHHFPGTIHHFFTQHGPDGWGEAADAAGRIAADLDGQFPG